MRILLLIFTLMPMIGFSHLITNKLNDKDGTVEVTFKGKVGKYPNFEDLNTSLGDFSNHLNELIKQSKYKILSNSGQATISNNEITINLKLVNSWDSLSFALVRFHAVFVTDNLYDSEFKRNISREDYLSRAYFELGWQINLRNQIDEKFQFLGSSRPIETNKISNLNPENPSLEYSLAIFGVFIQPRNNIIDSAYYNGLNKLKKNSANNLHIGYAMKNILPSITIVNKTKSEKSEIQNLSTTTNNQNNSNNKGTIYDAILKGFTKDQLNYLNLVKSKNADPKQIKGKICGYGFDICKFCKERYRYNKFSNSKISDVQFIFTDLGKIYLDGIFMFEALLSPKVTANKIRAFSEELKSTLNEIKSNNIYYCEGKPAGYCSKHD